MEGNNMGIRCLKCNHVIKGKNGLHLVTKCPNCGNKQKDMFKRVPNKISEEQKKREREWLESHKLDKNKDN